jgi:arylamine N-acetyltransferase
MATIPTYTAGQVDRYLEHINLPKDSHPQDRLELLTALQRHQLARVPFESLSLHYSETRLLSLDLDDLFEKIVAEGRGGYCMELNAFFGTILRSLHFELYNAAGRVSNATAGIMDGGWMGL